jgi:hypothetical protein
MTQKIVGNFLYSKRVERSLIANGVWSKLPCSSLPCNTIKLLGRPKAR